MGDRLQEAAQLYEKYLASPDVKVEQELAVERARRDPALREFLQAIEDSTRITAEDLKITITPCPID